MSHLRFILCFLKLGLGCVFRRWEVYRSDAVFSLHPVEWHMILIYVMLGFPYALLDLVVTRRTQRTQHMQSCSQLKFNTGRGQSTVSKESQAGSQEFCPSGVTQDAFNSSRVLHEAYCLSEQFWHIESHPGGTAL